METHASLAARLQHDARTPLNSVLGMVELLEGTVLDEEQRKYISVLRRSTETLIELVDDLPSVQASEGLPAFPSETLDGTRILLADDSEDNRFLIVRYLRGSGATVEEARDGAEALDMVRSREYDVVLMDVEMPVMDGFAAARAIRDWERSTGRAELRIIALTAHAVEEVLPECRAAGCDELITKPVRKRTLLDSLAQSQAPPDMTDLASSYLSRRRMDLPVLRQALTAQNFEAIRLTGHNFSGTGAGYGFPKISEIGAAMERAARACEPDTIAGLIDALEAVVRG